MSSSIIRLMVSHTERSIEHAITLTVPAVSEDWDKFMKSAKKAAVSGRTALSDDLHLLFQKGQISAEWIGEGKRMVFDDPLAAIAEYFGFEHKSQLIKEEGEGEIGTDTGTHHPHVGGDEQKSAKTSPTEIP